MSLQFSMNDDGNESLLRIITHWIIDLCVILCLAMFLVQYMGYRYEVTGHSMEPKFQVNDQVLVNRISYKLGKPHRFDVAVFTDRSEEQQLYMKRIVGLPGEDVLIQNGAIYINDELIETEGLISQINLPGTAEHTVHLGEDEYFVIGDNSGSSEDSRFSNIGNVKRDSMLGKVWFRTTPLKRIAFIGRK